MQNLILDFEIVIVDVLTEQITTLTELIFSTSVMALSVGHPYFFIVLCNRNSSQSNKSRKK